MNLTNFLTTIVTTLVLLLAATATTASAAAAAAAKQSVAARQRQERQNTCQGKYSIGGTADLVIADGTLVYPDSKDQCQYGIKLLAEGATEIRIKCCVKKTCGKDFIGVCQDRHKNCKGSLVVGRDTCVMGVPKIYGSCVLGTVTDLEAEIENPCPAAGQCCIPDCKTGSPKPLCKDSPEDPCCKNTNTQSSLPPLLLLNNNDNNNNDNDNENYDLSSPSLQQQSFLPQDDPSFPSSSEFLPPTDKSSTTEIIGVEGNEAPAMVQTDRFQDDHNAFGSNNQDENRRFTIGWNSNEAGGVGDDDDDDDDDDVPADWKFTS